jgi:hypothetical protein
MDGGTILFLALSFLFLIVVIGMNIVNVNYKPLYEEGFADSSSNIEGQVKGVLEPMNIKGICDLYGNIREFMKESEIATNRVSEKEASSRVEASLAIKIPGGALPCPLLNYPKGGSGSLEWLNFLQSIPTDFGARVVFMALYAKKELNRREINIKASFNGNPVKTDAEFDKEDMEPFTGLCPPTVADTRRAEQLNKENSDCKLPEDMSEDDIQSAVKELLDTIVKTRSSILTKRGVDPKIDLTSVLASAEASMKYIVKMKGKAKEGTLATELNLPSS